MDKRKRILWRTVAGVSLTLALLWIFVLVLVSVNIDYLRINLYELLGGGLLTGISTKIHIAFFIIYFATCIMANILFSVIYIKISSFSYEKYAEYQRRLGVMLVIHFLMGGYLIPLVVGAFLLSPKKEVKRYAEAVINSNISLNINKLTKEIQEVKKSFVTGEISETEYKKKLNAILNSHTKR